MRSTLVSDIKNKRQVNQYLRTPGTSAAADSAGPQVFPHSIQRLPLYTRRPTTAAAEDENINEQELQQQVYPFFACRFISKTQQNQNLNEKITIENCAKMEKNIVNTSFGIQIYSFQFRLEKVKLNIVIITDYFIQQTLLHTFQTTVGLVIYFFNFFFV